MNFTISAGNLLPGPPLICLVTSGEATDANFKLKKRQIVDGIAAAARIGVNLVQIREKNLSARLLFELTNLVVKATHDLGVRVLVNDRADIATAAGADGVHLSSKSLTVNVIRRVFPAELIVGVSTHSVDEVVTAADGGADYVVFGPVFATPGKGEGQGIDALRIARESVCSLRVLAIGGVDAGNVDDLLNAGADGVAAIRAFNHPESTLNLIQKLR